MERVERVPKPHTLVRIKSADIGEEPLSQPIKPHAHLLVRVRSADNLERRRVVLRAGYLFGSVDPGLTLII
jgi:hypothetical protein